MIKLGFLAYFVAVVVWQIYIRRHIWSYHSSLMEWTEEIGFYLLWPFVLLPLVPFIFCLEVMEFINKKK